MTLKIIKGNIFTSNAQTLVNPVNTVGVMGAGLALEFRLRYPDMFEIYKELCYNRQIDIGKCWLYKTDKKWILNFPTKKHWKDDSKLEFITKGLEWFLKNYKVNNIQSIAFPVLGANLGNLSEEIVLDIMQKYLFQCNLDIEIYKYDPNAEDDMIPYIKQNLRNKTINEFLFITQIKTKNGKALYEMLINNKVKNLADLLNQKGIGEITVQKLINSFF